MEIFNFEDFKKTRGWYVGNFEPSVFKGNFEVGLHTHIKGEIITPHYHVLATEINLMLSGSMNVNGKEIKPNMIFIFNPYEVANIEVLEDTQLIVIKTVSVKDDKYII